MIVVIETHFVLEKVSPLFSQYWEEEDSGGGCCSCS